MVFYIHGSTLEGKMRFLTVEQLALQLEISEQAIYQKIKSDGYGTVDVAYKTPMLVYQRDDFKQAYVISSLNMKGGCGKTTITTHLASLYSKLGFKVLLIDTDHQNQCHFFFSEPENGFEFDLVHALSGEKNISDCVKTVKTSTSSIDIITSSYQVSIFSAGFSKKDKIASVIEEIKKDYHFIFLDTSPAFDIINQNVAIASDYILIPVTPTKLNVEGMSHNFDALQNVAKIPMDRIIGIVPSIVDLNAAQQREYMTRFLKLYGNYDLLEDDEIRSEDRPGKKEEKAIKKTFQAILNDVNYNGILCGSFIPQSPLFASAADFGSTVLDSQEKSNASQSIKRLGWELLRRIK